MTVPLSTPLAQGRTAEIYPWDVGQILKLYRDWCPPDWVDYEARIARAVYEAGIPSPAPGEIVEVKGRRGLIYERLDGVSMIEDMNARPWLLLKHAHALAELQVQIHRQSIPGLPSYRDRLRHDIHSASQLSEDLREKVLAQLDTLPDGQSLCHGDYHPGNILITTRGPVVIDWMTACVGVPWADVARTYLLLSVGPNAAEPPLNAVTRMAVGFYDWAYRRRRQALLPDENGQIERWLPVIAAARLQEDITPERATLIEMVKEGLQECA